MKGILPHFSKEIEYWRPGQLLKASSQHRFHQRRAMRVMLIMSIFCIFFFAAICMSQRKKPVDLGSVWVVHMHPTGVARWEYWPTNHKRFGNDAHRQPSEIRRLFSWDVWLLWLGRKKEHQTLASQALLISGKLLELKKWCSLNSPFTPDTAFIKYLFDMAKAGENTGKPGKIVIIEGL